MPLEFIPKPVKYREWRRRALLGVYFPVAEPRPVYEGDVVDGAVNERRKRDSGYDPVNLRDAPLPRSEEHTSELQSLMRISYAVFCLKKKTQLQKKCNNESEDTVRQK